MSNQNQQQHNHHHQHAGHHGHNDNKKHEKKNHDDKQEKKHHDDKNNKNEKKHHDDKHNKNEKKHHDDKHKDKSDSKHKDKKKVKTKSKYGDKEWMKEKEMRNKTYKSEKTGSPEELQMYMNNHSIPYCERVITKINIELDRTVQVKYLQRWRELLDKHGVNKRKDLLALIQDENKWKKIDLPDAIKILLVKIANEHSKSKSSK